MTRLIGAEPTSAPDEPQDGSDDRPSPSAVTQPLPPSRAVLQREAEALLRALARPGEPTTETVAAAERLFRDAGEDLRARWLACELGGYGQSGALSLRETMGLTDADHLEDRPAEADLLHRVRGYRQYTGRVRTSAARPDARAPLQVPHFFGEPLEALRHLRQNADAIGLPFLEVESVSAGHLATLPSGVPTRTLEFPRNIFYRILSGLAVELELALSSLARG